MAKAALGRMFFLLPESSEVNQSPATPVNAFEFRFFFWLGLQFVKRTEPDNNRNRRAFAEDILGGALPIPELAPVCFIEIVSTD